MEYQTHRPITKKRQLNKQKKHANSNSFANHNHKFFTNNNIGNPIEKPFSQAQKQP